MRNRVMYVKDVQLFVFHHIHHFTGKLCFIRLKIKKWVICQGNFVVKNILTEGTQSNGLRIRDEVNFMSLCR